VSATITTLASDRNSGGRLLGRHVLISLVGFFCLVIAANAAMVYSAISTYSGVVATEPYRKGLHYNERVLAEERQQRLHWQDVITVDRTGRIAVSLVDADGQGIDGLDVQIVIGRPSTNRHDMKVSLVADAPGHYAATVAPLQPGSWIVAVEARPSAAESDPIFRARRRLWMAP
jgi:nitrogen fixation protein FixH